jgi:hypothetical protein
MALSDDLASFTFPEIEQALDHVVRRLREYRDDDTLSPLDDFTDGPPGILAIVAVGKAAELMGDEGVEVTGESKRFAYDALRLAMATLTQVANTRDMAAELAPSTPPPESESDI